MKRIFLLFISGSLLLACSDNDKKSAAAEPSKDINPATAINDSANFTSIQWLDEIHQNKGKVQQGQTVEVSWRFRNTGNKPLVIANASASCGCTVAEKPEQPIAPGAEGVIKAKFDSKGREGEQRKQVMVTANTQNSTTHELSFNLEVLTK